MLPTRVTVDANEPRGAKVSIPHSIALASRIDEGSGGTCSSCSSVRKRDREEHVRGRERQSGQRRTLRVRAYKPPASKFQAELIISVFKHQERWV